MQKSGANIARHWLWMTDIHLDFLDETQLAEFYSRIQGAKADGLMITGDIGTGPTVANFLRQLTESFPGPIAFVLGNHDFYRSGFGVVRNEIQELCSKTERLLYLPDLQGVPLPGGITLIGQDGWGDGQAGNYNASDVELNDFQLIDELRGKSKQDRLQLIAEIGVRDAENAKEKLHQALARSRDVIFLTHVPPFPEASLGPTGLSDPDFLPFFCCHTMGEMLFEIMSAHPDNRLFVFCGHTHSPAVARILPNLIIRSAGAVYGQPAFAGEIDVTRLDEWK